MIGEFKQYLKEHRDIIFTVTLLFVADHFLLNGALKAKLTSILHKVVDRIEKKTETEVPA